MGNNTRLDDDLGPAIRSLQRFCSDVNPNEFSPHSYGKKKKRYNVVGSRNRRAPQTELKTKKNGPIAPTRSEIARGESSAVSPVARTITPACYICPKQSNARHKTRVPRIHYKKPYTLPGR